MTTDKQTDYFKNYKKVEVITGRDIGNVRVVGQLKNGKWALWDSSFVWGGNFTRPVRMRDLSGRVISFETKEDAIAYSKKMR